MLFKKNFDQQSVNGVHLGNGTIAFRGVRLNVHCFYIDGVLIDTGAKSLEGLFKPFFNQFDIDKVVITHHHEDHTGCAAYLQEELQLPIFMSEDKLEACMQKADYPLYRQVFWGKRKPFRAKAIGETFQSQHASWRAIKTPGHAIDHLAFLNTKTGQLFSGDLYCIERTKVALRGENIPGIIESLRGILTYDFDEVYCCHAGYVSNGKKALQRKLDYLLELQESVIKLHREGKSPKEIDAKLFPKKYPASFFSAGEWDSIHIIDSIINQSKRNLKYNP